MKTLLLALLLYSLCSGQETIVSTERSLIPEIVPYQAFHVANRLPFLVEDADFRWLLVDEYEYAVQHQDWIEIRQIARLLTWAMR